MFIRLKNTLFTQSSDNSGDITVNLYQDSKSTSTVLDDTLNAADIDDTTRFRMIKTKLNKIYQSHKFSIELKNYTTKPTLMVAGFITQQWTKPEFMIDYYNLVITLPGALEVEPGTGLNVGKMWYNLRMSSTESLRISTTGRLLIDSGEDMILLGEDA